MKIFRILVALGCSVFMSQGYAAESIFNYDYIEVGSIALETQIFGIDVEGDSRAVSGSFDLTDHVNIVAGIQSSDFDFEYESDQSIMGVGYHEGTSRTTDLYLEAFYLKIDLVFPETIDQEEVKKTGYGINAGLRKLIGKRSEFDFNFSYIDVDDSEISFGIAGRHYFHRTFALGLFYSVADDVKATGLTLRVGF
jgi:hypothetical protein